MLKASVNGKQYTIEPNSKNPFTGLLEGIAYELDATGDAHTGISVLYNNQSFTVVLLNADRETKVYTLLINGTKYEVSLKDKFDELLAGMGMTGAATGKANNVKAPMPGLVLNVLVKEGDSFKPGDGLLVLEAMKMENIIKAAGEGTVKKINVNKGQAVEKGQVLIEVI